MVVHTFHMQHHLFSLFVEYTQTLNPQQLTTVDCSDQPLYAVSKNSQWLCPKFAVPRYVALFGGLHIEKAMLVARGNLIRGSGLENLLGYKQIGTIGLQTAALDVNHIHRGRYVIQLSSVGIYACLKAAYAQKNLDMPIFEWVNEIAKDNLMFKYWLMILNFQID